MMVQFTKAAERGLCCESCQEENIPSNCWDIELCDDVYVVDTENPETPPLVIYPTGTVLKTTGGLSIGMPGIVAIPGTVLCGTVLATLPIGSVPGNIVAGTNMVSPLTEFGLMTAITMSDVVNSAIYGSHFHPTPKGPSGPPTMPFLGA
jgi:hypothetical protein